MGINMILIRLLLAYLSLMLKIACFFIKHFDVTNSLLTSLGAWMLTGKIEMPIPVRIGMLIAMAVGSFLLQHFFFVARIIIGAIASFLCGTLIYALFEGNGSFSPLIPMGIMILIVGIFNVLAWLGKEEKT